MKVLRFFSQNFKKFSEFSEFSKFRGYSIFNSGKRRDSDITRKFGAVENAISEARFDAQTGKLISEDAKYFQNLIEEKFEYGGEYNTGLGFKFFSFFDFFQRRASYHISRGI